MLIKKKHVLRKSGFLQSYEGVNHKVVVEICVVEKYVYEFPSSTHPDKSIVYISVHAYF